jgi:hypothetical protein
MYWSPFRIAMALSAITMRCGHTVICSTRRLWIQMYFYHAF